MGVFVHVFMHVQSFQISSPVHTLHTAITHTGIAESHIRTNYHWNSAPISVARGIAVCNV